MEVERRAAARNSLPYALWGALGFGTGGAIGGIWFPLDSPAFPLAFGAMGLVGGASLGLATKSWKKAGILAAAELLSFAIGWVPLAWSLMGVADQSSPTANPGFLVFGTLGLLINGAIQGTVGVMPVWFVHRSKPGAAYLLAAGAAGFAIAAQVSWCWAGGVHASIALATWGAIGGALIGAALGYQYSQRRSPSTPSIRRTTSLAWWLAPIFLGLVGGALAWVSLHERDSHKARNMLWLGMAVSAIWLFTTVIPALLQ